MTTLAIKILGTETTRTKGDQYDTEVSGNKARAPRIGKINIAMVDTVDFESHMTFGAARHTSDIILRSDAYTFRTPDGVRVSRNVQAVADLLAQYNKFTVEMNTNREIMRLYDLFVLMAYVGNVFHTLNANDSLDGCIAVNGAYSIANNHLFYDVLHDAGIIGGRDLQYSVLALVHGALRRPLNAARQHVIPGILLAHPDVRRVFNPAYVLCGEYIASRFIGMIPGVPESSPEFYRSVAGMVDRLLWKYADEVFTGDTTDTLRSFFQSRMHTVYSLIKDWMVPAAVGEVRKEAIGPKDAKPTFFGDHGEFRREVTVYIPTGDDGEPAIVRTARDATAMRNALDEAFDATARLRASAGSDTGEEAPTGAESRGVVDVPQVWKVPEGVSAVHATVMKTPSTETPNLRVLSSKFPVTPKRKKERASKEKKDKGHLVGPENASVTTSAEDEDKQ